MLIINQAGKKSGLKGCFDYLHQFRLIRNKLVHDWNYNELTQGERKKFNSSCMAIFGQLELECNCKELYEGEKHFSYRELYKKVILPDVHMYHHNPSTKLFLDAVSPSFIKHTFGFTPESVQFESAYCHVDESTIYLRDFIQADSNLVEAWNEHVAAQTVSTTNPSLIMITFVIFALLFMIRASQKAWNEPCLDLVEQDQCFN